MQFLECHDKKKIIKTTSPQNYKNKTINTIPSKWCHMFIKQKNMTRRPQETFKSLQIKPIANNIQNGVTTSGLQMVW